MINAFLASIPAPNRISFPGLGIDEFTLNPVAFRLPLPWAEGGHPIMWYGIIITLAMVIGFCVALRFSKKEGIKSDDMYDLAMWLIIFCIIGARLYYVLSKPGSYRSFMEIISIWNGGLAIYGGIIAGALTILVFTRIKKIGTAKLLDAAAPGLILGQAIGRWGNFCNAEAHGVITELPWRMGIAEGVWANKEMKEVIFGQVQYYHPTFLYESLWNIIGFAILLFLYKRKKFDGQIVLSYAVWYGFGRFFIEGLRTDSLYLLEGVLGKTIRVSQLVAAVCVAGGIIAMVILSRRAKKKALDEAVYESVYEENNAEASENAACPDNNKEN